MFVNLRNDTFFVKSGIRANVLKNNFFRHQLGTLKSPRIKIEEENQPNSVSESKIRKMYSQIRSLDFYRTACP